MTQRQLAEAVTVKLGLKADYAPQTVSGWLTGKWVPDTFTIAAVAKIFGCSPGWLAFGEDAGVPSPEARERESLELETAQRIAALVRRQVSLAESLVSADTGGAAAGSVEPRRRRRA
jgi:transcriptional regulator with XRE-family HTH domain